MVSEQWYQMRIAEGGSKDVGGSGLLCLDVSILTLVRQMFMV